MFEGRVGIKLEVEICCSTVGVHVWCQCVGKLECVCVFCEVWVHRGSLFTASIEVCEGRSVCNGLLGLLLPM